MYALARGLDMGRWLTPKPILKMSCNLCIIYVQSVEKRKPISNYVLKLYHSELIHIKHFFVKTSNQISFTSLCSLCSFLV